MLPTSALRAHSEAGGKDTQYPLTAGKQRCQPRRQRLKLNAASASPTSELGVTFHRDLRLRATSYQSRKVQLLLAGPSNSIWRRATSGTWIMTTSRSNQSVPESADCPGVSVAVKEQSWTEALIWSDSASAQICLQLDTSIWRGSNSSKQPLKQVLHVSKTRTGLRQGQILLHSAKSAAQKSSGTEM